MCVCVYACPCMHVCVCVCMCEWMHVWCVRVLVTNISISLPFACYAIKQFSISLRMFLDATSGAACHPLLVDS